MQHGAVGKSPRDLLTVRRPVRLWNPEKLAVVRPPENPCRQCKQRGGDRPRQRDREARGGRLPLGCWPLERHHAIVTSPHLREKTLQRYLRFTDDGGQIVCDAGNSEVFLHVDWRGLQPGEERSSVPIGEWANLIGDEPLACLLSDRRTDFFVARRHGFIPIAPSGAGSDPSPGPDIS